MKALIIGFGQDAKLLAIRLKERGIFFKILVRPSTELTSYIPSLIEKNNLLYGDASDLNCLLEILTRNNFTHVFNVAGNTFSQSSKNNFYQYLNANTKIFTNILSVAENIRNLWIYHPLSSEILSGNKKKSFLSPRNAYGVSKAAEFHIANVASNNGTKIFYPILFNHESGFRSKKFFTAKLIYFLLENKEPFLEIWNTTSLRDWGSASQYMKLIISASIKNKTGCFHLGTAKILSVADFVNYSIEYLNIKYEKKLNDNGLMIWKLSDGRKIIEKARDIKDEKRVIIADKNSFKQSFGKNKLLAGRDLVHLLFYEYEMIAKKKFFKI